MNDEGIKGYQAEGAKGFYLKLSPKTDLPLYADVMRVVLPPGVTLLVQAKARGCVRGVVREQSQ